MSVASDAERIIARLELLKKEHVKFTDTDFNEFSGKSYHIEACEYCSDYHDEWEWPCATLLMLENYEELIKVVAGLRPPVLDFAEKMEAKLKEHDKEHTGWMEEDSPLALRILSKDFAKHSYRLIKSLENWPFDYDKIIAESIHCANFLMMIADNAAKWKEAMREKKEAS